MEENWRINPILMHIIDDFRATMDISDAMDNALKLFNTLPNDKRILSAEPFTCPKCKQVFTTEKENG